MFTSFWLACFSARRTATNRPDRKPRKLGGRVESLEGRELFAADITAWLDDGVLHIQGTSGADEIVLRQVGNVVQIVGGASFLARSIDRIEIDAGGGDDTINLSGPAPTFGSIMKLNQPTIPVQAPAVIAGGKGNDTITGGAASDVIDGGAGNDVIRGQEGNDRLTGGAGHDQLFGDEGADHLWGSAGNDELSGGSGTDRLLDIEGKNRFSTGGGDDIVNLVAESRGAEVRAMVEAALSDAARRLQLDPADFKLLTAEGTSYPHGFLAVMIPGYRVILSSGADRLTYEGTSPDALRVSIQAGTSDAQQARIEPLIALARQDAVDRFDLNPKDIRLWSTEAPRDTDRPANLIRNRISLQTPQGVLNYFITPERTVRLVSVQPTPLDLVPLKTMSALMSGLFDGAVRAS